MKQKIGHNRVETVIDSCLVVNSVQVRYVEAVGAKRNEEAGFVSAGEHWTGRAMGELGRYSARGIGLSEQATKS